MDSKNVQVYNITNLSGVRQVIGRVVLLNVYIISYVDLKWVSIVGKSQTNLSDVLIFQSFQIVLDELRYFVSYSKTS